MRKALRIGKRDGMDRHMAASSSNHRPESDHASTRRVPRWVIVFAIMILLLVLMVVMIEMTTNGMGNMQMAIPGHLSTIITYGRQAR